MFLDRMVRYLLPRQGHFFALMENIGEQIIAAATVLAELNRAKSHAQFEDIAKRLKEIEKKADEYDRILHEELDRSFVTPIDREDLAALVKVLDNVVDGMEHSATFAALFQFDQLTDPMRNLVSLTADAATALAETIPLLRKFGHPEMIKERVIKVHTLESDGDSVYRQAVAALFTGGLSATDLVRQKDMLFALEAGLDECEDAMDVIRSVMVKNG